MIRRLTLINFMSHEHTVLDLTDGVNVLIGPNNCGKSAVVEALRAVCENSRGNYMIRHGEKECRVIVETGEGDVIEWRRKQKNASYVLNGKPVHRLHQPENLQQLLKMPLVEARDGGHTFDVHLGLQKEPIFLINQSGSRIATFFATASDAHYLLQMQEQHRKNVRENKTRVGHLQGEIKKEDATLKNFAPLPGIEKQINEQREQCRKLEIGVEKMGQLRDQLRELEKQQQQLRQFRKSKQVLQHLESPPELFPVGTLAEKTRSLDQLRHQVEIQKRRLAVLETLVQPPEINDLTKLRDRVQQLTDKRKELKTFQTREESIQKDLEACREKLRRYARQQPTCPQCQRPWSENELFELMEKGESHVA